MDGQVVWTETFNVPGATADELYDKAFAYLTELTQGDNQLSGSKVALVNKGEHSIGGNDTWEVDFLYLRSSH